MKPEPEPEPEPHALINISAPTAPSLPVFFFYLFFPQASSLDLHDGVPGPCAGSGLEVSVCRAFLVLEPGAMFSFSAPAAARQLVVWCASSVAVWRSESSAALSRAGRCFCPPWALVVCVSCSQHGSSQYERDSESLRPAPAVMCCILSPDSWARSPEIGHAALRDGLPCGLQGRHFGGWPRRQGLRRCLPHWHAGGLMHAHVLGTTTSRKIAAPDPEVRRTVEGDNLTLNLRRGARALPCWNHIRDPRW